MKDILGREIHDGDICVGKGTGRYVKGMDVGVWDGRSITFRGGGKRSMGDIFLVVNPSEDELKIKQEILSGMDKIKKERDTKNALKSIPLGKLEVGGIYKDASNSKYIYLGKRKITLTDCDRKSDDIKEGHCYIIDAIKELRRDFWKCSHNITVLKGAKRLVEFVKKIELSFPMTNEDEQRGYGRYSSNYHYKLKIE